MFSNCVSSLIKKFGRSVTIIPDENNQVSTKAFIQPLRYINQSYFGEKFVDIGYLNKQNYLYIGDKNARLDLFPFNTKIISNNDSFVVKRAHPVYLGEKILYVWAIIQVFVEDEQL